MNQCRTSWNILIARQYFHTFYSGLIDAKLCVFLFQCQVVHEYNKCNVSKADSLVFEEPLAAPKPI